MSTTAVRVLAGDPPAAPVPFRLDLRLDELVVAARVAGLPLPVRTDAPARIDRLADRLSGTSAGDAAEAVAAALARVDDEGPDGARASLAERGLLDGDTVAPAVVDALTVLAVGPLGALLDVSVVRAEGDARLRSWWGVSPAVAAQLSTADGLHYELAWYDPALWASQVTRAVTVEPWVRRPAPLRLPDHVSLPSELLAGSEKAHRERRTDLLPAMAATFAGRVRMGDPGQVRVARDDEVLALLATLGTACRGRLRLVTQRRDRADGVSRPAVAAWLLFDDGWHELRPGPDATAVLRRRDARDLGLLTAPAVAAATGDRS